MVVYSKAPPRGVLRHGCSHVVGDACVRDALVFGWGGMMAPPSPLERVLLARVCELSTGRPATTCYDGWKGLKLWRVEGEETIPEHHES